MTNYHTHSIRNFPSKDSSLLVRRKDGLVIAARSGHEVGYGEDPRNQDKRIFVDAAHAYRFLRSLADRDMPDGTVATIEETSGEKKIVDPGSILLRQ